MSDWRLTHSTIDGSPLDLHGAEVSITFDETTVAGKGPVNRFHGGFEEDGERLTFGPLAATRMAGPPELMEAEHRFFEGLGRVVLVERTGQTLVLRGNAVELVFQRPQVEDPMGPWLVEHPAWRVEDGALVSDRAFPDFAAAWAFATRVALAAERAYHHPDITVGWGRVRISLVSHEAGGITDQDRSLAGVIDEL